MCISVQVRSTSPEWVANQFKEASGGKAPATVAAFIQVMAMALIDNRTFEDEEWVGSLMVPYLTPHMGEPDSKSAGQAFVESCRREVSFHSVLYPFLPFLLSLCRCAQIISMLTYNYTC